MGPEHNYFNHNNYLTIRCSQSKNLMYSIYYDRVTDNVMYIHTYACTHVSSGPGMEIIASTNYYHHMMGRQTLLLHSIYSIITDIHNCIYLLV